MAWISLCDVDELTECRAKPVEIDGFNLAVYLYLGQVYVLDSLCPHAGYELSSGIVEDGCAICPGHNWNFRLTDGQMPSSPGMAVTTYKTRLLPREGKPTLVQADLPMY